MNNRKPRVYVNGTSALKIQPRDNSQGNVVCLGRSMDGRLFVDEASAPVRGAAAMQPRKTVQTPEVHSLRDDLRLACEAMGVRRMEQTFVRGTAAGKVVPGLDKARGLLFGAAVFFAAIAVVLA